MNQDLRDQLITLAKKNISSKDRSHDFSHALRVLHNAERITEKESGDLDIIIPAALFHDIIVYQKNHPSRMNSQKESASMAEKILKTVSNFPKEKIELVKECIIECSFTKGIVPETIESKIIQDADGLEATGAISIMRTYSSTGQMKRPFYDLNDPFCKLRSPDSSKFALDLFYIRLLKVAEKMHTKTAKEIAQRRTSFLIEFLKEFELELEGK
jgi:uncharacterized protein